MHLCTVSLPCSNDMFSNLEPSCITIHKASSVLTAPYVSLQNGLADMQMMMEDSGQPPYWSSTILQSVASILFLLLGAAMLYFFSMEPVASEDEEINGKATVERAPEGSLLPLEGQSPKGEGV